MTSHNYDADVDLREQVRMRIAAYVLGTFRVSEEQEPHPDETALVERLTDAVLPLEVERCSILAKNARLRNERDAARAEAAKLWEDLTAVREERDGHRKCQRDAEHALIMFLAREGGTVKFTPAEQISAPFGGSFVSTHEVGTGNEVLSFVPARQHKGAKR